MYAHFPKVVGEGRRAPNYGGPVDRNLLIHWTVETESGDQVIHGECRSLLKNFAWIMAAIQKGNAAYALKDPANVSFNFGANTAVSGFVAANGVKFGVGTGATAVTSNDVALAASAQESAAAVPTLVTTTDNADTLQYTVQQTITSDGNRTLKEIGLFVQVPDQFGAPQWTMIIRDTIADFVVTNGQSFIVKFTFTWQTGASSYLKNFAKIMRGICANQNEQLVDTANATFTASIVVDPAHTVAVSNAPGKIFFGTGNAAVVMNDYQLTAPVEADPMQLTATVDDATKLQWVTNASLTATGAVPGYAEMGMRLAVLDTADFVTYKNVLVLRTVFGAPTGALAVGDVVNGKYIHEIAV